MRNLTRTSTLYEETDLKGEGFSYRIFAVSTGARNAREDVLFAGGDPSNTHPIAVLSWCMQGPSTIVVDSGLDPVPLPGNEDKFSQGKDDNTAFRLAEMGVNPDEVSALLLTHLHHDHAENVAAFPNAISYISASGWEWLKREDGYAEKVFPRERLISYFSDHPERLCLVEDGQEFIPGITAVHTGGHTPCSQMFLVSTDEGTLGFTGDEVMLYRSRTENRPVGLSMNPEGSKRALEIAREVCVSIFPSHDPLALGKQKIVHVPT